MLHETINLTHWKSFFPLEELRSKLRNFPQTMQLGGMRVNSLFHLAIVEQIREESLKDKHLQTKIPTDIFLWNIGEPNHREITKIGGLPYRASNQKWPHSKSNQPLTFIGQICFKDSKELIDNLPGDVLLIFANTEKYGIEWDSEDKSSFYFEWVSIGDLVLVEENEIPQTKWKPLPMYGSIFRTHDYPNCDEYFSKYNGASLLSILEATKISGTPAWIQYSTEVSGRFLCSIASIEPAISGEHGGIKVKSYPYVNRPEPINFHDWYHSHTLRWGDMGVLNIFLDENEKINWDIQCH